MFMNPGSAALPAVGGVFEDQWTAGLIDRKVVIELDNFAIAQGRVGALLISS
jgi:hypothetical protein